MPSEHRRNHPRPKGNTGSEERSEATRGESAQSRTPSEHRRNHPRPKGSTGSEERSEAIRGESAQRVVVEVSDLRVEFPGGSRALRGVSLSLAAGESLGIVGESGSGKSMLALSLLGLVPPPGRVSGAVTVDGCAVYDADDRELRALRGGRIAMVFQDPMTALNPVRTIGAQIVESIRRHRGLSRPEARARAVATLRAVGVPSPEERYRAYPHMLSGGLRQRAVIALALANEPAVLVADEPTTALDATIQAQILDLLREQVRTGDRALILITHDLSVAARVCDRIAVVYAGCVVEQGPTAAVLDDPRHPYTQGLLRAVPRFDASRERLVPIPGTPPRPDEALPGCRFAPRCARSTDECRTEPDLTENGGRLVACWHPGAQP